ncbi:MAG: Phosphate starvation-inducible protein PhoH, predicted ATPase, partial [uncultured Thermoleophilia bacterium]
GAPGPDDFRGARPRAGVRLGRGAGGLRRPARRPGLPARERADVRRRRARDDPGADDARRARRAGRPGALDRPADDRRRDRGPERQGPRGRRAARRRLAAPRQEDRAEDGQPEAVRRRDPLEHGHVRHRARGHRQDVPGDRPGRGGARRPRGVAHHPHPAGRRGGGAARLSPWRSDGQDRPVPATAVRRAARHARRRARHVVHGEGRRRGRPSRVHARPDAQRQLHHPRRGAEHVARADADVPDPARFRLEDRRHGGRDADRPPARAALGPDRRAQRPAGRARHLLHPLRPRRRGPAQDRAADRRGLSPAGGAPSRRPTGI